MATEFKGLENKLEGVHVGDFLHLQTESGDRIGGYVANLDIRWVKLSHESPDNKDKHGTYRFPKVTIGDREYPLKIFSQYQVVDLTNSTSE